MNSFNQILESLANELSALLSIQNYLEYGNLKNASKPLFQHAFETGVLFMDKSIDQEVCEETFFIAGSKFVFPLNLIGLDYQENEFTRMQSESIGFNHFTTENY